MSIFRSDADRMMMLDLIGEAAERHRCRVLAYCLMDNHVHLTMHDLDGDLSKALKYVNGVYAQRFNMRHGRTGHLFEGRFWNSLLETDSYLATATEYVHRNPVEAGIVALPEEYRWSSYRAYAGLSKGEAFLEQDIVLSLYGGDPRLLRSQTEVSRRNAVKEAALRKRWPAPVLGGESFLERHLEITRTSHAAAEISHVTQRTLDLLTAEVSGAFGVTPESVVLSRRGARNHARLAAVHLAASVTMLPHSQIAAYFSLVAAHSVSTVSKRCLVLASRDPEFSRRLGELGKAGAIRGAA